MKNIRGFLSANFQFLEVNFSIYLNRRVFVMTPEWGQWLHRIRKYKIHYSEVRGQTKALVKDKQTLKEQPTLSHIISKTPEATNFPGQTSQFWSIRERRNY